MQQTKDLLEKNGMWADQWRIATPICAPSRSELFSSRYLPEIASTQLTPSPKVSSGAVNQLDLRKVWPHAFPIRLREDGGYRTGLFGKCETRGTDYPASDNIKPEAIPSARVIRSPTKKSLRASHTTYMHRFDRRHERGVRRKEP